MVCPSPAGIRISISQKETILELHKRVIPSIRIANSLGLHASAVRAFLRRKGLAKKVRPIGAELLRDLYCNKGLSIPSIGRKIAMPKTNVEYWMKKYGIPSRWSAFVSQEKRNERPATH